MDYNERKKIRQELSNFKKKMDKKGIDMLLNRSGNEDIKLKLDNCTITPQEAEEFLKSRLNGVTSIKLKGKGRFVEPNEQLISMAKHNLSLGNENNLIKIFEEIEGGLDSKEENKDSGVQIVDIVKLKPHPHNYKIYEPFSDEDDKLKKDFINSIETYGILEPIVVNENFEIISGHRRFFACLELGISSVPVRIKSFENEILAIIHFNKQREKSGTIIRNEFNELDNHLFKKLGGRGKKNDGIDIYNTISEMFNISRGSATKLYKIFQEDKDLFVKVKLPQNPNGSLSIDKAYFSLKSVKTLSVSKKVTEKNHITLVRNSISNLSSEELFSILKTTYPFSLMGDYNSKEGYTNISLNQSKFETFDKKRKELIEDLEFKKSLTTEELLMFEKLDEIQRTKISNDIKKQVIEDLWRPSDILNENLTITEIENLNPVLVLTNGDDYFNAIRVFTHSLSWSPNVGRNLKYIVIDKHSNKVLGCIVIGSDVLHLEGRDTKIGWNTDTKIGKKKINHIGMATTILPTFLLGYNFLGTKLIAGLVQSKTIENDWKERYGDVLVGITTTSLYGSFSSYNGIPNWSKCGLSKGKVILNPSNHLYKFWHNWLKDNHPDDFNKSTITENNTIVSGPKQKIIKSIFNLLDLKQTEYYHLHQRGVYFYSIYENTIDFLNDKIEEKDLVPKKNNDDSLLKWWKPKAINRYQKLIKEERIERDFYWYEKMSEKELKDWLMNRGKSVLLND